MGNCCRMLPSTFLNYVSSLDNEDDTHPGLNTIKKDTIAGTVRNFPITAHGKKWYYSGTIDENNEPSGIGGAVRTD